MNEKLDKLLFWIVWWGTIGILAYIYFTGPRPIEPMKPSVQLITPMSWS